MLLGRLPQSKPSCSLFLFLFLALPLSLSRGLVLPGDEEVHWLFGLQHLGRPLCSGHGGQLVGIVARVEGRAGAACSVDHISARLQHVAHLAVEVGIGGQTVEEEVSDPLYGVSMISERGVLILNRE